MEGFSLNCNELQEYQQNRYPYLMIDHVDEVIPGKSAKGYKNLTMNEWFFPSHFPDEPNMPGALQLESLAQMLTIAITTLPGNKGLITNSLHVNNVRFIQRVVPGNKFCMEAQLHSWRRGIAKCSTQGIVDGKLVCEADWVFTIPDILDKYKPGASS